MSVQEYLDKHMLSRKIEDAVNAAVRAKTSDPVLFISNHMRKAVPSVITKVKARQILDSRGIPTIEVDLHTNKGMFRASAPGGDSTGMYEAVDLRDGDKASYLGNGVTKAVMNVNERISEALVGMDPTLQSQIDQAMTDLDKTEKKGELGANAILAVSIAACKAGGKRAGNNLAVQEIMILPIGANKYEEAVQMGYHRKIGPQGCNVGEDGGFAPNISSLKEGLDLVKEAIGRTGYSEKIKLSVNVGATDFCIGTKYDLDIKSPNKSGQDFKTGEDMIELYKELCSEYPIVSFEDPFDKEDWEHAKHFSGLEICQVVGGDMLMSNPKRIDRAVRESSCNALLLKVNQVGTITEIIDVVKQAKDLPSDKGWCPLCRGERVVAKYNQACNQYKECALGSDSNRAMYTSVILNPPLLRIEEELGDQPFMPVRTGDHPNDESQPKSE
ncbi:unnamed protein product [Rhodiola kirilowii]